MLKLNFSLETSEQRNEFVSQFFRENPKYKPTQHELDTISNYILYGKDEVDGLSVVDRHEVEIETKYKSYTKRKLESLDELMETPGFNENTIVTKYSYRNPKPTIDREADKDIPGIGELWAVIDVIAHRLAVAAGEEEPAPNEVIKQYTQTELYKLKHYLIELRKQQYVLKEAFKPTEQLYNPTVHKVTTAATQQQLDWEQYYFYPLGLIGAPKDNRFANPQCATNKVTLWDRQQDIEAVEQKYRGGVINFCNEEHIYLLAKAYQDLEIQAEQDPEAPARLILDTIDFYAAEALKDTEVKQELWKLKCRQASNEFIKKELSSHYGVGYSENYISTIFKKNICADIAATAKLHADYFWNRDEDNMWKTCRCCGKRKLRDSREFMRKSKSTDGLASRCKECDKAAREQKKNKGA